MTKTALGSVARAAALVGLLALAVACRPAEEAKKPPRDEPIPELAAARWIEPRLTGSSLWQSCKRALAPDHIVEAADCPQGHLSTSPGSIEPGGCEDLPTDHRQSVRALLTRPGRACTDAVIDRLESLAKAGGGAPVLNDLAAAYYVRAQRADQPSDFLRALDFAQRAVAKAPGLPEARFNVALSQEALGLSTEALASWDEVLRTDGSPWSAEAREHRNRLTRDLARRTATQWPLNRERLPEVIRAGDRQAVAQLITPFPAAAQRYVENEVLPIWAQARVQGRHEDARLALNLASAIATELARLTGDRNLLETVEKILQAERSPHGASSLQALEKGHLELGEARSAERAHALKEAAEHYQQAERWLARAGSPLRGGAVLGLAIALHLQQGQLPRALGLLAPIEREARERKYGNLWGRILAIQALVLLQQSRYLDSLAKYEEALGAFERNNDLENVANLRVRKLGVLYVLGQDEPAWREAFQALREAPHVVEAQSQNILLGETAIAAVNLGYPQIALAYQNAAVRLLQGALATAPTNQEATLRGLRDNLAIALRARSSIQFRLGRFDLARRDLDDAMRLSSRPESEEDVRQALLARAQEVAGKGYLRAQPPAPRRAIAAFSEALSQSANSFRTYRATLLVQRAEAYRQIGDTKAAEKDLEQAIAELRVEEAGILERRKRGQREELWSAYFSRFQDAYQLLIRLLATEGRPAEAFQYAERARAFEPLNLVLQMHQEPRTFAKLARNGEPLELGRIQAGLPRGTYLLEFTVLADRTLVWVVSRDHFEIFNQPVRREAIAQWADTLQREAEQRDQAFEAGLSKPYSALLAGPLKFIQGLPAGRDEVRRLVFVPDGAIHGLPLAALRDPTTKRHVIEDFPVAVAASATLYVYSLLRDEELALPSSPRTLLVGDPAFDTSLAPTRGLSRLPRASREVDRIHELYAGQDDVLKDVHATATRFLDLAGKSAVVHFAGHAITDAQIPFRSLLVLAPAASQPGILDARELLNELRLERTELVVLSACSSAGGHAVGPEGLAALVRPLLAAGAPAVIGSLWNVGDDRTEELLVDFHRHYREGLDAARALQRAQLDLMKDKRLGLRSALAWAPFQVIGYASSPFQPNAQQKRRDLP
jgi:CHAT domain-containing protein